MKTEETTKVFTPHEIIFGIIIAPVLFLISRQNYLLFHSVAEIFSIVIASGIFMFSWNNRKIIDNDYFVFLGIAYMFIGGIDLFHTLAYKGIGIFTKYDANLPTQFWIIGRYIESISLLIAPLLLNKKINYQIYWVSFFGISILFLLSVFKWNIFPVCFLEGVGLTPFKKISEYIIALILLGAILQLYQNRKEFDQGVFNLVIISIILTIFAELAFTFYISVYGISNLIGHYLKILSYYLIYKAIIQTGLNEPYKIIFRKLEQSKNELQIAFDEIKTLRGIIPICMYCKKIKDDKETWGQLEIYLEEHSDADFSHGICPECYEKQLKKVKKIKQGH